MATISERKKSTGELSYRVQVRRRGKPFLSMTFPTYEEATKWASENEKKYIRVAEDFQEFKKKSQMILERHSEFEGK